MGQAQIVWAGAAHALQEWVELELSLASQSGEKKREKGDAQSSSLVSFESESPISW